MKLGIFHGAALMLAGTFAAAAALAQGAGAPRAATRPPVSRTPRTPAPAVQAPAAAPVAAAPGPSAANLQLPSNPVFLGDTQTSVRKATAIVNGTVITATDVDQRLALIVLANNGRVQPDEMQRLRDQVLRNPVDET